MCVYIIYAFCHTTAQRVYIFYYYIMPFKTVCSMHALGGFVDLCAYNFNSSMHIPNLFLSIVEIMRIIIIEYDIVYNGWSVFSVKIILNVPPYYDIIIIFLYLCLKYAFSVISTFPSRANKWLSSDRLYQSRSQLIRKLFIQTRQRDCCFTVGILNYPYRYILYSIYVQTPG